MDLYRLLQKANLSSYYDAFLSNGGDDVHQLLEATDEELLEIMRVVDMANKPLHVIRLKKTLNDIRSRPEKYSSNSNNVLFNDSQRNYSFQSGGNVVASSVGNWTNNNSTAYSGNNSQARGIPVNLLPNATLTENERLNIELAADDLIKAIPEYPVKDHSPSRKGEAGLYEVIKMSSDHSARIPAVYRYSAIYGRFNRPRKTGKAMNHHEVAVNEAAAQLCLRMPSLLSRREDLYPLARQAVKIAEAFWKSNYRSRSHKKKRSNPNVVAIANEFANYHKNNPQAGYLQVQEKIEVMKSQLYEMTMQQDKLRLAFRVAKSGAGGPTMSEIQKEIDALSGVQQGKIAELGRYVLEYRKFRNELNLPQTIQGHMSNNDVATTSVGTNLCSTHNLISLAPVQQGTAANIFAATAGGLTVFPGLTQVKSDSQNATFLINNPGRGNDGNFVTASGNINNPAPPIVALPPGVMALNVANSHSQTSAVLAANSVASYMGNANNNSNNSGGLASQFPNFSVFTNLGQIKAISAASINSASPQQSGTGGNANEIMKIDNGHPTTNVYQAYIT